MRCSYHHGTFYLKDYGFQGFFTSEEMIGVIRHAEHPQRVSSYISFAFTVDERGVCR
jgi:hypothetical protein